MQDRPSPTDLLAAVARQLREAFGPALGQHGEAAMAYQARVAANMLDIAARQLTLAPAAERAELQRLRRLLGEPEAGSATGPAADADDPQAQARALEALNRRLAGALAEGRLGLDDAAVVDHLWQTALDKLAVDQPKYASFRRALARQQTAAGDETAG